MNNKYLTIFNINKWIAAIFFLIPTLFLSQVKYVLSTIDLIFYFLYLFTLFSFPSNDESVILIWKRNLFETLLLIIFFIAHYLIGDFIYEIRYYSNIFNFIYCIILIDLSYGFLKIFSKKIGNQAIISLFLIFLSFLLPGIGIYYLRRIFIIDEST